MSLQISIKVLGAEDYQQKVLWWAEMLESIGQHAPEWFEHMEGRQTQAFAEGGGQYGQRWAPNEAKYARWKAGAFPPGDKVLILTGEMAGSLTDSAKPGAYRAVSHDSIGFGTTNIKAQWHNEGEGSNPIRVMLSEQPEDVEALLQIIADKMEAGAA